MNRYIKIALVLIVLAVIVNDGGRWGQATIDLRGSTGSVLDKATLSARRVSQAELVNQMSQEAAIQGIRVTQFQPTSTGLHIWTEEDVWGTWVVGPYIAMSRSVPFSEAFKTPFTVRYDAEEAMR